MFDQLMTERDIVQVQAAQTPSFLTRVPKTPQCTPARTGAYGRLLAVGAVLAGDTVDQELGAALCNRRDDLAIYAQLPRLSAVGQRCISLYFSSSCQSASHFVEPAPRGKADPGADWPRQVKLERRPIRSCDTAISAPRDNVDRGSA